MTRITQGVDYFEGEDTFIEYARAHTLLAAGIALDSTSTIVLSLHTNTAEHTSDQVCEQSNCDEMGEMGEIESSRDDLSLYDSDRVLDVMREKPMYSPVRNDDINLTADALKSGYRAV